MSSEGGPTIVRSVTGIDGWQATQRYGALIMKTRALIVLAVLASLLAGGCKAAQPTSLERKEAATLVSAARFALQLKDDARAETLLTKAAVLCPDNGKFWWDLGAMRVRLGEKVAARTAYRLAREADQATAKAEPQDTAPPLQQIYGLALLGRTENTRAVLVTAQKNFPDDRAVRVFAEGKQIEKMTTDPRLKEIAL